MKSLYLYGLHVLLYARLQTGHIIVWWQDGRRIKYDIKMDTST